MSDGYRKIDKGIWRDTWFRAQSCDVRNFYIYLLTNPASHVGGIYKLPLDYTAYEAGLGSTENARALLVHMQSDGKVEYDEATETLWVHNMRRYQAGVTPSIKVVASIKAQLAELRDSEVKRRYMAYYGHTPIGATPAEYQPAEDMDEDFDDSDEEPAPAPTTAPTPAQESATPTTYTLTECLAYLNGMQTITENGRDKKTGPDGKTWNPTAAVARLYCARFPDTAFDPDFARLGKMAAALSGKEITLAKIIWACGEVHGNPHDYIARMVAKNPARFQTSGKDGTPTVKKAQSVARLEQLRAQATQDGATA